MGQQAATNRGRVATGSTGRQPTQTRLPLGQAIPALSAQSWPDGGANFDDSDGFLTTSPVDSFPAGASPVGALDMFGNAWEFTSDTRRASWAFYEGIQQQNLRQRSPDTTPTAPGPGLYVAVRGGSFFFDLRPIPEENGMSFSPKFDEKPLGFGVHPVSLQHDQIHCEKIGAGGRRSVGWGLECRAVCSLHRT